MKLGDLDGEMRMDFAAKWARTSFPARGNFARGPVSGHRRYQIFVAILVVGRLYSTEAGCQATMQLGDVGTKRPNFQATNIQTEGQGSPGHAIFPQIFRHAVRTAAFAEVGQTESPHLQRK